MDRYRIYLDKDIQGPFSVQELLALPGFSEKSLICEDGDDAWQPAKQISAIRFQLAPNLTNISEISTPTPEPPRPVIYQPPNVTRVSYAGDFVSPDFQFGGANPGPKLRMRRPVPLRPIKSISLPVGQPPLRNSVFVRLTAIAALISITSGLWAYGIRPSIPAPITQWWRSTIATLSRDTPLPNSWRPGIKHPELPFTIPAPVSQPVHSKPVPHKLQAKKHAAAHAARSKLKHPSHKPWFNIRNEPTPQHP